jgi:ribosome biogenesis GTPase / thiamine phosphate phosphatase
MPASPSSSASPLPRPSLPGWSARRATQFEPWTAQDLVPARVVRADRDRWLVLAGGDADARTAVVRGRLRHEALAPSDLPTVGDWVALALPEAGDGPAVIHAVLPRDSAFRRQAAGGTTVAQVVAANVDIVFLVAGLDGDFNLRRIERYVTAIWESGAQPVIVLNKADVPGAEALPDLVAEVEAVAIGVPVVALSAREGDGLEALASHLLPGRTVALVGSSGVGKSTLVNALLGEERQATGAVREDDQRGRHTTSHRELVPLPDGAFLLDTPGMREFALWGEGEDGGGDGGGLETTFADVEVLAADCRFGDCAHDAEPGCAVRAALEGGTLDPARHASWVKLRRELRAFAIRHDARLARAERARWKSASKTVKAHMKRKYGP